MGFNPFKIIGKVIAAPIKLIGKVVKSPVGKVAADILEPVYEAVVPAPVRKVVKKVSQLAPLAKLIKSKGASNMNPFEKLLREVADVIEAVTAKEGTTEVVAEVVDMLTALGTAYKEINKMSVDDKRAALKVALDNVIGEEPDALFGPNGSLVKFDIPFVGDEMATDLVILGIVNLVVKDDVPTNGSGAVNGADDSITGDGGNA